MRKPSRPRSVFTALCPTTLPAFATLRSFLALASSSLLAISLAHAGQIWDGGGGDNNWNTAANWDGDVLPAFNNAITFTGNTRNGAVNNLTADTSIGGINLTNDGTSGKTNVFTLSGAKITLGGDITTTASAITDTISLNMILDGNRAITTNTNHNLIVGGIVSETGGARDLSKNGSGTLRFDSINTYSGTTTINAGAVEVRAGTAGGSAVWGTGPITINQGTTIYFNPATQAIQNTSGFTVSGPIALSGGAGTANIRFSGNDNKFVLSGGMTGQAGVAQTLAITQGASGGGGDRQDILFTGAIANGSGGTLGVSVDFAGGSSSGQSAFVNLRGQNTFTGNLAITNSKGLNAGSPYAGAWLTIGGERYNGFTAPTTATAGNGFLGAGADYPGNISISNGTGGLTTLAFLTSANQILRGVISGTGSLHQGGSGKLTLTNANTYTGNTTVSAGSFELASGGSMTFAITDTTNNRIAGTGAATLNGTFNLNTSAVTVTNGSWTLVNITNKTYGGSFGLTGFSGPVGNVYTKTTGNQFWSFDKSNGVLSLSPVLNTGCVMLICDFGALGRATINEAAGTAVLTVPPNQVVTALAPTFALSTNATISPASGSTQNFTNPVVYRVTAQDGVTFKDYTVRVESYETWTHTGSMFINTTANGANLSGTASVSNFPLLLRFNSSNFNFAQAQSDGRDIRFITASGAALPYQIEHWDAVGGKAAVWVLIPTITGNSTQEIKMYWGKTGVGPLSSGRGVFNSSTGYASVIHLDDTLMDETGLTTPANVNSTVSNGLIGRGRTFTTGQGVLGGSAITGLPTGSGPFSTGVWIRSATSGTDILGWGIQESSQKKVVMQLVSPPHINLDCWFGGANVTGTAAVPISEWTYVVHTFQSSGTRLYVNGVLDASNNGGTMQLQSTSRFDIGGWSGNYNFIGDMDEVRISNVVRSADWVKLEYENQKPMQTLVGGIVPPGSGFSVSPASLTMNEGSTTTLTAQAGGAQKTYWIYKKNGQETVLATDQLSFNYTAGRVTADDSAVIQFKAVFSGGIQTIDVPLTVLNSAPDPEFTLVPSITLWDGRQTMTVTANISNLAAMQSAGFGTLNYKWSVSGVAVVKQANNGTLTLTRSQGSGQMTVSLAIDNGGTPVSQSTVITVQEPVSDAWVQRTPDANEKPVNKQFFARNPETNLGTIHYKGTQGGTPDTVYLKVYKTPSGGSETLDATHRQPLVGGSYAFTAPIAAGLITYRVVYGTTTGGIDTDVATVTDLVCGDAFIIEGQSNAVATDYGSLDPNAPIPTPTAPNTWIRTYGLTLGWGSATIRGDELQLGLWGWILANRLLTGQDMPVCIINGAVGGTRIDQHRPNPAGRGLSGAGNVYSIYANLYNRVVGAKLTHGIRGLFWHQGEQNQGSGGIDPDYDYKFYQQYFVDISAAWKQDFPNLGNYWIFQIWPAACGDQSRNDQLRDVQRTLPRLYSNMKIMSTHGIVPGSSCHYSEQGYRKFSDLVGPLVEQDVYGDYPSVTFTAPNLRQAYFTTSAKNEIALVFDQDVAWNPGAPTMLFLANAAGAASGSVTGGSATGNTIKLQVAGASAAATITYLKGLVSWNQANILYGTNGIAALTFADVPISTLTPYQSWAADPAQALTPNVNDGPLMDPDLDGIENLLEFVLKSPPMTPSTSALPTMGQDGGQWVFEYDRNDDSLPAATTQVVQYGGDLSGWTDITIPATSSGAVIITPGAPADHVRVVIPNLAGKVFARLKVTQ